MAGDAKAHELALRNRAGALLMSTACQNIDFRWAGIHVDGSSFSFIALAMLNKATHSPGIHFRVEHQPAGVGASYDPQTNTFSVPSTSFGSVSPWEKQAIVHECTHALIDATSGKRKTFSIHDEMAAFVAGALFNIYSAPNLTGPFPFVSPTGDTIGIAAHQVALGATSNKGYAISPITMDPLRKAILASKNYAPLKQNPRIRYGNNGVRL